MKYNEKLLKKFEQEAQKSMVLCTGASSAFNFPLPFFLSIHQEVLQNLNNLIVKYIHVIWYQKIRGQNKPNVQSESLLNSLTFVKPEPQVDIIL